MPDIIEGSLLFHFESGSKALKFDATNWHCHKMKSTLKAMDIVCSSGDEQWWIEVKGCIGFEDDNRPRLSASEPDEVSLVRTYLKKQNYDGVVAVSRKKPFIIDEVYMKFRDTLAGMTAASRSADSELLAFCAIQDGSKTLKVLLVLTWSGIDFKRLALRLQDKLNSRLSPFRVVGYVSDGNVELPGQCWSMERVVAGKSMSV